MTRIAGINLDDNKHLEIALTAIYGVGRSRSREICRACNVSHSSNIRSLSDDAIERIRTMLKQYVVEGDLRRTVSMNIKRLMDINCYRGKRHRMRLPVRGQRTSSNAQTARHRIRKPKFRKKEKS